MFVCVSYKINCCFVASFNRIPMIQSNTVTTHRPTPSIIITTLVLVPTHVCREFVVWCVQEFHLVADPLGAVPFVALVPEAAILFDIGMGLTLGVFLARGPGLDG